MKVVRSTEEKNAEIQRRLQEGKKLGQKIDNIIQTAEVDSSNEFNQDGCAGNGLCPSLFRKVHRLFNITTTHRTPGKPIDSALESTVFGLAGSNKKTAFSKLATATEAMKLRACNLESRATEYRLSAKSQMQRGNKELAMRELKKAMALEKQAYMTQSAVDALEAQSDMLEQSQLQKEVAAALGETAKSMKKQKNMISKAEDAVDAVADMKDMHDDMTQVMSGLGDLMNNDVDNEELLSELNTMLAEDEESEAIPIQKEERAFSETIAQTTDFQSKLLQRMPKAPNSQVNIGIETQGLLASQ
jgi:hypothetical protein